MKLVIKDTWKPEGDWQQLYDRVTFELGPDDLEACAGDPNLSRAVANLMDVLSKEVDK